MTTTVLPPTRICRYCPARIRYITRPSQSPLVVDAEPDPAGDTPAQLVKPARYGYHPYLTSTITRDGWLTFRRHHCPKDTR